MKTYLQQSFASLFKAKRFIFMAGETGSKGPEAEIKSSPNPDQALAEKTGMTQAELKKYQADYKLTDLQHKLGTEIVYNPNNYKPEKLYALLAANLEKTRSKYGDEKEAYDKKAALYLKNVEYNDASGKIAIPPDQIAIKGQAFAGLYEELGQHEKSLLGSLEKRELVESVMRKLEGATGSVTAVETGKRYEASLSFLQQQRAMMKTSMDKLADRSPLDLVEKAKGKLQEKAWYALRDGINHAGKVLVGKGNILSDSVLNGKQTNESITYKIVSEYLGGFLNSLNANEKATLVYNGSDQVMKIDLDQYTKLKVTRNWVNGTLKIERDY